MGILWRVSRRGSRQACPRFYRRATLSSRTACCSPDTYNITGAIRRDILSSREDKEGNEESVTTDSSGTYDGFDGKEVVIVGNDASDFDVNTSEGDEVGCIVNSSSMHPMKQSADCIDIQPKISSVDVPKASETAYVTPRDGNVVDEYEKYPVQFFPVVDSDHIRLQGD